MYTCVNRWVARYINNNNLTKILFIVIVLNVCICVYADVGGGVCMCE